MSSGFNEWECLEFFVKFQDRHEIKCRMYDSLKEVRSIYIVRYIIFNIHGYNLKLINLICVIIRGQLVITTLHEGARSSCTRNDSSIHLYPSHFLCKGCELVKCLREETVIEKPYDSSRYKN